MRISVAEWAFLKPGDDAVAFYRSLRRLGVEGAELAAADRRGAALDAGLVLVSRDGPGRGRGWNRVSEHDRCMVELEGAVADAAASGIPDILVFTGNKECQREAASIAACIQGLGPAAELAARHGRRLLLEVFNTFDHPDYAADSSAFAFEVVRAVGSRHLRVLYDAYHMWRMGEDVSRTLFDHLDLVGHVHLARSPDRKVATDNQSVALVRQLQRSAYPGWLGLEWLADDALAEISAFMDRVR